MDDESVTYHFRDIKELIGDTNSLIGQVSSRMMTAGGPLGDGYGIDLRAKQTVELLQQLLGIASKVMFMVITILLLVFLEIVHHW